MNTAFGFTDSLSRDSVAAYPNTTSPERIVGNYTECIELSPARINPCDHAGSVISRATRSIVDDVVYVGVLPFLTVGGMVVNVINMAVFVTRGLGDRVNICLFSLSLADLLALMSLSVRYIDKTLVYVVSRSWAYNVWVTSLIRFRLVSVHAGFQLVTNFISIVIAVDRWVCVTWPLHAARMLSSRKTCLVMTVFSILVFTGIQFVAFKYDVECAYMKGVRSRSFIYTVPSMLYRSNPVLMETLDTFVLSSLIPTLSLLITATVTVFTAMKLRRAATWRGITTRGGNVDVINRKEKATTSMLIFISCVYIVCVSPRVIRAWCRFFVPEFRAWSKLCNLVLLTEAIMNALLAVNSSLNFFIYYVMGSRFKSTLRHLMTCFTTRDE